MKKPLIVLAVLAVMALTVAYIMGAFNPRISPVSSGGPLPGQSPAASAAVSPPASPSPALSPQPTASAAAPSQNASPASGNVNFELLNLSHTGSGLSYTVTADIANTGTSDAHNVWGKIEVFSGSSRIQVNGSDYLRVDIGTLKAGSTVTKQVPIEFSMADGLKMMQNGAEFVLTVTSDEKTQVFK